MKRAPLVISVGCPSGIGPEVSVRAAADFREPVILVGDRAQLRALAKRLGVDLERHTIVQPGRALAAKDRKPGSPTKASGAAQLAWIDRALDLVTSGEARAMVTGPVSKDVIASSGAPGSSTFRGHTEHLQHRLKAPEVVMAFWSPLFSSALVTTHLPLAKVPAAITAKSVASATFWLGTFLARLAPSRSPRVVVCGLNPHAGEHGLLGREEMTRIEPGIALARKRAARAGVAMELTGPLGAETAFRIAKAQSVDGVVAMYHDQATIPMKLLGFGDAVNVSLGLPIVRTSVDHGTGYDRAGRGDVDPSGMRAALDLAARLTRRLPIGSAHDTDVRGVSHPHSASYARSRRISPKESVARALLSSSLVDPVVAAVGALR